MGQSLQKILVRYEKVKGTYMAFLYMMAAIVAFWKLTVMYGLKY